MNSHQLNEKRIFSQFLYNNGLLFTNQRKVILEQVYKNHSHFDIEEIVQQLSNYKIRVSRATIYRTLAHLEECKLIRKIDLGHGHAHYEHTIGHQHHEHLYCEQCGKIIEFDDQKIENSINDLCSQFKFTLQHHTLQIFGICNACSPKDSASNE